MFPMTTCFFASDLHGQTDRYEKLSLAIERDMPNAVFLGGDLLPAFTQSLQQEALTGSGFIEGFMRRRFQELRSKLGNRYPSVFLILGNDDPRIEEELMKEEEKEGLWIYLQERTIPFARYSITGYACIPPSPFRLKDWERYDVSRFVDPGCTPPEEGSFSTPISKQELTRQTIQTDLERLAKDIDADHAVWLFHAPPYDTVLDRAGLDGLMVDHVPVDVHVGSIAIRRFVEQVQPLISMHGHVHESARITGSWRGKIGRTHIYGAAHDGPELALIRFTLEKPDDASRDLL